MDGWFGGWMDGRMDGKVKREGNNETEVNRDK